MTIIFLRLYKGTLMVNLQTMILKNCDKLNDSEKKIIQFVVSNPKECRKLSLAKLAKKLYVSESAIFRLCKKLGLSGYSELKFGLDELAASQNRAVQVHTNFAQDLTKANADVEKYFHSLNLNELYTYFEDSHTIYIYSTGWQQQIIAQYLAHELFIIGVHAIVLPAAFEELKAISCYAKKGDVLFIISFTGDNEILNQEISRLKVENDKFVLVSFTDMKQNKLASLTEYNMYFPTVVFAGGPLDKQKLAFTPAFYLIDLLVSDYSAWHYRKEVR